MLRVIASVLLIPRIPTGPYRLTNEVIYDGGIALLLSLRCSPSTGLLMLFGSCMPSALVPLLHCVQMVIVAIIVTMVTSHVTPSILHSNGRLGSLLVHLVLHEDGF